MLVLNGSQCKKKIKRICACEQTGEVLKLGHFRWMEFLKTYPNLLGSKKYLKGKVHSRQCIFWKIRKLFLYKECTQSLLQGWCSSNSKNLVKNTKAICNKSGTKLLLGYASTCLEIFDLHLCSRSNTLYCVGFHQPHHLIKHRTQWSAEWSLASFILCDFDRFLVWGFYLKFLT